MANKNIFKGGNKGNFHSIPVTNVINKAGGKAYNLTAEGALAQYAVTGCLNQTFYAGAEEQVDKILELAFECNDEFVAKVAVYAHEVARMKDTPALLLNVLANRGESGLRWLKNAFPRVVTNTKMLRNFVQILRSGKCGRKSMGSAVRNLVRWHLAERSADSLTYDCIGNTPSLADVVRMVHPKPESKEKEAFYSWLLGSKKLDKVKHFLPSLVKAYEDFKTGRSQVLPKVEFRMLTALPLTNENWKEIARSASWNQIRMNLNTFERHGCYQDNALVSLLANKLADGEAVRRSNAFPYQLLTTYQATVGKIPSELSNALQLAMEVATENVPAIEGTIAIAIDTSGSMDSSVTGHRVGATSVTRCVDVAGLFGSAMLRKNKNAVLLPFDTVVHGHDLNPFDSVMTNASKLAKYGGGGTNCASALQELNKRSWTGSAVIFVSDNESWVTNRSYGYGYGGTSMMAEWALLKQRNGNQKAKLVCIDIVANATSQVTDNKDRLNVSGFTDAVFSVVDNFLRSDSRDFSTVIKDAVKFD